ncbi:LemA family protein [Fusobacterium necrophorum]|nr:LemA family protein [Fusobacterium necrophorum]
MKRRDYYNTAAELYNAERLKFPFVLFSSSLGFREAPYLDLDSNQKIDDFNTDDGEILKDIFRNAANTTTDFTKKGIEKIQKTAKSMNKKEESAEEEEKES